jgi:hypothetical protein
MIILIFFLKNRSDVGLITRARENEIEKEKAQKCRMQMQSKIPVKI